MALRTIVAVPEKILRRKARPITKFGDDLQVLVEDMIDTMREAPGVGLAAPQVAEPVQLIVVEYGDDEDETVPKKLFVMANPVITRMSPETEVGVEEAACPSPVSSVRWNGPHPSPSRDRIATGSRCRSRPRAGWRASSSTRSTMSTGCCSPTEPIEDRV